MLSCLFKTNTKNYLIVINMLIVYILLNNYIVLIKHNLIEIILYIEQYVCTCNSYNKHTYYY